MMRICKMRMVANLTPCAGMLSLLALTTSCGVAQSASMKIQMEDLENAPIAGPVVTNRAIVAESPALNDMSTPLGPRLGLIQVRRPAEWSALQVAAPDVGPCPDLVHGSVIGVYCRAGLPLNGDWPVELDNVRVRDGAGLVSATFEGGSYLPDGTTYLEWTYVAGLTSVLVVEVNGLRFFAE